MPAAGLSAAVNPSRRGRNSRPSWRRDGGDGVVRRRLLGGSGLGSPSQATEGTRNLLESAKAGASVHVPSLWDLEVANALLAAERRKLILAAHRKAGLTLLMQLRIVIDEETSTRAFFAISDLSAP